MRNYKVLLVEDNPSDIGLVDRSLSKYLTPDQLVVVNDGQEVLDYLLGDGVKPPLAVEEMPALVLLDLHLPKIDGLDVLKRIRATPRTKYLPVVVLTQSREEPDVVNCYECGIDAYMIKPFDFVQFRHILDRLDLYWLVTQTNPKSE
jgi:two-component system, response regulator